MYNPVIAVVGLGYVGLPLAVELGKHYQTLGFDSNEAKLAVIRAGHDQTGEVSDDDLRNAKHLRLTTSAVDLVQADIIIVTVPTPVDESHRPDLGFITAACETVGGNMKKGTTVIFESTVYPGLTEEICVPLLEKASGYGWKRDFHVAYSPERINPGDKTHRLTTITKVVAADDPEILDQVAAVYETVVAAGIHRAPSIKVAEAAKVIENTQRDLNIALMNELAIIFNELDIDTQAVLEAARTKWNFLPFYPGLVGGHCIGVDPYYLTHKAELIGYQPQVILAGRHINDGMGKYIAEQTIKQMVHAGASIKGSKVLILGMTFKENCPDVRNSRVIDIIEELLSFGVEVSVHDPLADKEETKREYNIELTEWGELSRVDAIIAAVAHNEFIARDTDDFAGMLSKNGCFIDVKSKFDPTALKQAGIQYWRL